MKAGDTPEDRERRAAYMREYRRKNADKLNEVARLKAAEVRKDAAAHAKFRESANANNRKYAEANREKLREASRSRNRQRYTPERGRELREKYRDRAYEALRAAKYRAKKAGVPFDLTREWYSAKLEGGCAATQLPFDLSSKQGPWVPHVDRVIPALGYVPSNCRIVCAAFNMAKLNWTDADVMKMAKALLDNSQSNADQ